jgi:hypothetical protein
MTGQTNSDGGLVAPLATVGVATVVSLLPQLTDIIRFTAALIGLIAACIGLYKAAKK